MVTYHLDNNSSTYPGLWVLIATYGNDLSWVVGHYADRRRAQHRLDRLLKMVEAQRQLDAVAS